MLVFTKEYIITNVYLLCATEEMTLHDENSFVLIKL